MGKIKSKNFAKLFAGAVLLATVGILGTSCGKNNSSSTTPSSPTEPKIQTVLNLMRNENDMPVHVKAGEYQLLLTEQFAEATDALPAATEQRAIDGMKKAVEEFNTYSENVKFKLVAQNNAYIDLGVYPEAKTQYSIPCYLDRIDQEEGSVSDIKCDVNGLITESQVVFNSKYMFNTWDGYSSLDEMNLPQYSYARTITEHQLMHLVGFADTKGADRDQTITRYDLSKNTKEFTNYDQWSLAQYNYEFADGTQPEPYNYTIQNNLDF